MRHKSPMLLCRHQHIGDTNRLCSFVGTNLQEKPIPFVSLLEPTYRWNQFPRSLIHNLILFGPLYTSSVHCNYLINIIFSVDNSFSSLHRFFSTTHHSGTSLQTILSLLIISHFTVVHPHSSYGLETFCVDTHCSAPIHVHMLPYIITSFIFLPHLFNL